MESPTAAATARRRTPAKLSAPASPASDRGLSLRHGGYPLREGKESNALVDIGNNPARDCNRGWCDRASGPVRDRHLGAVHVRIRMARPHGLSGLERQTIARLRMAPASGGRLYLYGEREAAVGRLSDMRAGEAG